MDNISIEYRGDVFRYDIEMRTDIGGREEQQDSAYAYCDESLAFAIVCDGMGGTENGAQASRIAVDYMRSMLKAYLSDPVPGNMVHFLSDSMTALDSRVTAELGMQRGGTTAVAVALREDKLFWFSAGDSRLYIFRGGELVQATRDHNYYLRLNEQLERGAISQEHYDRESSRGEALISFMGVGGLPVFDLTSHPLQVEDGDILLLTTDGLYKAIPQDLIGYILRGKEALSIKADKLIRQIAVLKQSVVLDNTTFALIKINNRGGANE